MVSLFVCCVIILLSNICVSHGNTNVVVLQGTRSQMDKILLQIRSFWTSNNKINVNERVFSVNQIHVCLYDDSNLLLESSVVIRFEQVDAVVHRLREDYQFGNNQMHNPRILDPNWRNLMCLAQIADDLQINFTTTESNGKLLLLNIDYLIIGDIIKAFMTEIQSSHIYCLRPRMVTLPSSLPSFCNSSVVGLAIGVGKQLRAILNATYHSFDLTPNDLIAIWSNSMFGGVEYFTNSHFVIAAGRDWDGRYDDPIHRHRIALLEIDGHHHSVSIEGCLMLVAVRWPQFNTVSIISSIYEELFLANGEAMQTVSGCLDSAIAHRNAQQLLSASASNQHTAKLITNTDIGATQRVFDTFMFNDEIELLQLRLQMLADVVDFHILVECAYTFTGLKKPLYYDENKDKFEVFSSKIIHVVITELPHMSISHPKDVWDNEYYSRDAVADGLISVGADDRDVILLADVDEIPFPDAVREVKGLYQLQPIEAQSVYKLYPLNFMYNLTCFVGTNRPLRGGALTASSYSLLKSLGPYPSYITNTRHYLQRASTVYPYKHVIYPGCWHLSYFGGILRIKSKLKSFSHQNIAKGFLENAPDSIERTETESPDRDTHHIANRLIESAVESGVNLVANLSNENPGHCHRVSLDGWTLQLKAIWDRITATSGPMTASAASKSCKGLHIAFVTGVIGEVDDYLYIPMNLPPVIDAFFIANSPELAKFSSDVGFIPVLLDNIPVKFASNSPEDYEFNSFHSKNLKVFPQSFVSLARSQHPEYHFPDAYDFVVWSDNKYNVKWEEILPFLEGWNPSIAVVMSKVRPMVAGNIYKQFDAAMSQPRYALGRQSLEEYMADQQMQGYVVSDDQGGRSLASSFIVYNVHHPDTATIQNVWYTHIRRAGIQCQISLYFVAQRFPNSIFLYDKEWAYGRVNIHDNYDDAKKYLLAYENDTSVPVHATT